MTHTMKHTISALALLAAAAAPGAAAASFDPDCVVERWSDSSTFPKVIDINFSDTSWPDTWNGETARDCPDFASGAYVNAVLDVNANGTTEVRYPVMFHNCAFATNASSGGFAGTTAAFGRQFFVGENCTGNSAETYNNWTVPGHTVFLEDNIRYDDDGIPTHGEAGFVQMCRDAAPAGSTESLHGWMEIDHIPYVERVQWSWSSTSWGRGIKCDIRIGSGEWRPLVWMGSDKQKQGWTVFSDQGYFMENVINASDVSLRWRVWDGENLSDPVQPDGNGGTVFTQPIDPLASMQAPRVHKIQIFGQEITPEQADFARANPLSDVGELTDLGQFGVSGDGMLPAPDADAPVMLLTVAQDGSGDYTSIQEAVDAVPDLTRGIIYIRPGIYEENVSVGRPDSHRRFISLIGEDPSTTVITSSTHRGGSGTSNTFTDCAALSVFCSRFYAENLTVRNTAGPVGQAEALYTSGDAHLFRNCVISGYQDTYKANVGARGYFTGCTIEGSVDFIYDGGLEWFDNCIIRSLLGGYVTAPAESGMPMTRVLYPELSEPVFYAGLFFSRCTLEAAPGVANGSVYLGRPWKETSGAAYLGCTLGAHIAPAGWQAWNGSENTSSLYEFRSLNPDGTPADISRRASFSRQASEAEAEAYFSPTFLFNRFSKVSFDYNRIATPPALPANFIFRGTVMSWDQASDAAGYLVYRNGEFDRFAELPVIDNYDSDCSYSVRAVSRTGAMSAAAEARESVRLTAFPTAEGFGKFTSGGRGGRVVKVTSLADDGSEGTLRWAFAQHPGEPITILFDVTGEIPLASELRVSRSDFTLAGQSAPGTGIVITRNKVNFGGSQNFIVRNLRFRIGQKSLAGNILADNACGAENCSNFIFDHCSFGWSVEENMNTADSHFLTVQHCMVHEGLYNAGHSKGARGYGCQWGGSPATYHHNLLAHNKSRSCRFNGARGEDHLVFIEYANNVNYNFGGNGGCYGGENTAPVPNYNGMNSAHECNFMHNYYLCGPASGSAASVVFVLSSFAREGATSWAPAKWYLEGNAVAGSNRLTQNNWAGMQAEGSYSLADIRSDERIVPEHPYYRYSAAGTIGNYIPESYMLTSMQTAAEAYASVVEHAGTVNRDKVEKRVADDARLATVTFGGKTNGVKTGIIDTEQDAEGFFAYDPASPPTDTDGDGMPDAWERENGLDPDTPDNNRLNSDGYTALEVYLNSLMGEVMDNSFSSVEAVIMPALDITFDSTTATLLTGTTEAVTVAVYATDGRLLGLHSGVTGGSLSLAAYPRGLHLISVSTPLHAPRVLKVIL